VAGIYQAAFSVEKKNMKTIKRKTTGSKRSKSIVGRSRSKKTGSSLTAKNPAIKSAQTLIQKEINKKDTEIKAVDVPHSIDNETKPIQLDEKNGLDIFKLPLTSIVSFAWSWLWRAVIYSLIVFVTALIIAFMVGIVIGIIFVLVEIPEPVKHLFTKLTGYFIMIFTSLVGIPFFLRFITTRKLGKFRLMVFQNNDRI
jgi:hypothetical protein